MGWWKVAGTEDLIGDGPLDALGDALDTIREEYQEAFGRKPTRSEWERLLLAALGHEEPEYRVLDEGVVTSVRLGVTSE